MTFTLCMAGIVTMACTTNRYGTESEQAAAWEEWWDYVDADLGVSTDDGKAVRKLLRDSEGRTVGNIRQYLPERFYATHCDIPQMANCDWYLIHKEPDGYYKFAVRYADNSW
jgi:hypothetical protein